MANLNKVLLIGNLVHDPRVRHSGAGTAICELRLAVNRRYNDRHGERQEETCFMSVDVFGPQAESCGQYLHKGSSLFVEGRLCLDQWQDAQTGQNRSRLKVVAEWTQFLDRRRSRTAIDGTGVPEEGTEPEAKA